MIQQNAKLAYRVAEAQGANPLQLVVALYDAALDDIRGARAAQQQNDIETRTRKVNHCLLVLAQLQAQLDFDRGGEVASQLDRFYSLVRGKLLEACIKASAELFAAVGAMVSPVRNAWHRIASQAVDDLKEGNGPQAAPYLPVASAPVEPVIDGGWTA